MHPSTLYTLNTIYFIIINMSLSNDGDVKALLFLNNWDYLSDSIHGRINFGYDSEELLFSLWDLAVWLGSAKYFSRKMIEIEVFCFYFDV